MSEKTHLSREELEAKVAEADALAQSKANFLATMSHEIRTPMQTVYGILELIADEKPDAKIAEMIATAQNSASGLLEILDDILDLAKMDADKMELDVFEVPVRLLVRGLLEALAVKVHGVNVELIDDIEQDVPFVVIGDPKRLRQIIMNLCSNAVKFTHDGSVRVRVSANTQHIGVPLGGVGLRFEVIDTGIGMPEEVCGRLFENFTQADSSTSRKYGGTGLGLSISKKLVELMGGKIGVHSKVGEGSTFWFEIPTQEVSTDTTTLDLPELDGISVLSVEDHPQGAKEIVNSLRSMGATVESCGTYKEGLELATARPFDVGVIDQGLPDGLGMDLIKDIMKVRPNMGLVMYTVRDDVGLSHSLKALGATYLTKPASRLGLGEAVLGASAKSNQIEITGPTKMLIAEDTDSVRDILQRQLDKLGVEADFAVNGKEALKALETGQYGILITDLHMPELDGYGVVEHIRGKEEGTDEHFPVIVLTADVQMAQRETYMRHGFDECLLKPVSLGQLQRLMMRWGLMADGSDEKEAPAHSVDESPVQNDEQVQEETKEEVNPQQASLSEEPVVQEDNLPPAVDQDAMIAMMGAFDDGAIEMLGMFVDMTTPLVESLRVHHDAGDIRDVEEVAHSLKGAARSACCPRMGDIAEQLQDDAGKNSYEGDLVAQIEAEFARITQEVSGFKGGA